MQYHHGKDKIKLSSCLKISYSNLQFQQELYRSEKSLQISYIHIKYISERLDIYANYVANSNLEYSTVSKKCLWSNKHTILTRKVTSNGHDNFLATVQLTNKLK